jgi:hypothetical protein
MDENRLQAYLNLIQELLSHSGEEQQILDANPDLIDTGLMQIMLVTAADLTGKSQLEEANHLINIVKLLQVKLLQANWGKEEPSILQTYIYTESSSQQSRTSIPRILRNFVDAAGISLPVESTRGWSLYIGPGSSQSPTSGKYTTFDTTCNSVFGGITRANPLRLNPIETIKPPEMPPGKNDNNK